MFTFKRDLALKFWFVSHPVIHWRELEWSLPLGLITSATVVVVNVAVSHGVKQVQVVVASAVEVGVVVVIAIAVKVVVVAAVAVVATRHALANDVCVALLHLDYRVVWWEFQLCLEGDLMVYLGRCYV